MQSALMLFQKQLLENNINLMCTAHVDIQTKLNFCGSETEAEVITAVPQITIVGSMLNNCYTDHTSKLMDSFEYFLTNSTSLEF